MHDSQSGTDHERVVAGNCGTDKGSSVGGSRGSMEVKVQDHDSPVKLAASSLTPTMDHITVYPSQLALL